MTLLVPAAAALGLMLVVVGAPPFRKAGLAARVEPYLGGLAGAASPRPRRSHRSFADALARRVAVSDAEELQRRLASAGASMSPHGFKTEQVVWSLTGFAAATGAAVVAAGAGLTLDPAGVSLFVLIAALTGWLGRDWALGHSIDRRAVALREELPAAIDLLILSLMAGESVPAALMRIGRHLRGALSEEIELVVGDIRTGSSAVEALEAFARRTPDPTVARLVDALCTAIEKGAPLADVLRAQADDARDMRRRQLLETGGRREVWMLVPVVFLVMPVVVVFALYPGLVSLDLLVP